METKLENIKKLTKKYPMAESFIILSDRENAWSDGFMADLSGLQFEEMKAKATINKDKLTHYTIEDGPETSKIMPDINGAQDITDVEWDLSDNNVIMTGGENETAFRVKLNPVYIRYFIDMVEFLNIKFKYHGENKPVSVWVAEDMIGLIMPIAMR